MKKEKILIVGAGLAGLTAAYTLAKSQKYKVDLIESKDSLGGRVHSKTIQNQAVDFGGFIVYPWYQNYLKLAKELKIDKELKEMPLNEVLYDINSNGKYQTIDEIDFPNTEKLKMLLHSLPELIKKTKLLNPELSGFDEETIASYIDKISPSKKAAIIQKNIFDTIAQGYCYGPIDKYRLAFCLPIFKQTALHGDIKSAYFFPGGSDTMTDKLAEKLLKLGGKIHLNTQVTKIKNRTVYCDKKKFSADKIIFAQTVSEEIYKNIFPDLKINWRYTSFVTCTLEFDHSPSINDSGDWGAIFIKAKRNSKKQILSTINLRNLYSNDLCGLVNVNVVIKDQSIEKINKRNLKQEIQNQVKKLWPSKKDFKIIELVKWGKAMPIATEKFVKAIQKTQGENNYFFAGDYLGCPSMEVAIQSGLQAAERVLNDIS